MEHENASYEQGASTKFFGEVIGVIGTSMDITERKQTDKQSGSVRKNTAHWLMRSTMGFS